MKSLDDYSQKIIGSDIDSKVAGSEIESMVDPRSKKEDLRKPKK